MKKLIALLCLTDLLLAGCGVDELNDKISKPDPVNVTTTEVTTEQETEPETKATTTKQTKLVTTKATSTTSGTDSTNTKSTTSTAASGSSTGTATFTDRLDSYADLYKKLVQDTWDKTYDRNDGSVIISYALYDIDKDQIPELLFKHGTCEADYVIDIYTVDHDAKLMHVNSLGGGHTSFAYDEKTNELVLVWGHMGEFELDWYTMDNDFNLKQTDEYSHILDSDENYDKIMFDMGVWNMDYITALSFDKDTATKSYIYYAYSEFEEIDGLYLDFTYNGGAFR